MKPDDPYPELIEMIRLLYDEVRRHNAGFSHSTPEELMESVREFLVAAEESVDPDWNGQARGFCERVTGGDDSWLEQ